MFTGVCAGLGRHAGIDPVLFRVAFALLFVASGTGLMLYAAAFLLMRNPQGRPGLAGQWTRRSFSDETVFALLTAIFTIGLLLSLAAGGIGLDTLLVGTLLAIAVLAARAHGADLIGLARSAPDRVGAWRAKGGEAGPEPYGTAEAQPPRPESPPAPLTPPVPHPFAEAPEARTRVSAPLRAPAQRAEPAPSPAPGTVEHPRPGSAVPPHGQTLGGLGFAASSEPFAPHGPYMPGEGDVRRGPYQPLDPRRRGEHVGASQVPPVATAPPPAKAPRTAKKRTRPKSYVGAATLCLSMIVGGVVVATQSVPGSVNVPVVGGAVLVTIGLGLLVATWFGRGMGLVAAGTAVALVLMVGSAVSDTPGRGATMTWAPTSAAEANRTYKLGFGSGTLDLSGLVLAPGSRTTFDAEVSVGELTVILPPTVRAEVDGRVRIGDVQIGHSVRGGTGVRHRMVLEPEVPPKGAVATIVLNVVAGIGDVDVRHAA